MGTTLTALTSQSGIGLITVVAIEGYQYLLTDGPPSADNDLIVDAWAGTDWSDVLSGLEVEWNVDQRLSPWEPFDGSNASVTLKVMDASGTGADTFGVDVFNKENMVTSRLTDHDIEPDTTTVTVGSASGFAAAPGTIYIGCEAIGYGGLTGNTFNTLTRGKWSPFAREDGSGLARTHRLADNVEGIDADATFSTTVSNKPIDWRGRWVGIWLHRNQSGSGLDVKAQAHLAFAGKIANVRDGADGCTYIECMSVMDVLKESVILRDQWRGRLKPGVYLQTDTWFDALDARIAQTAVSGDADRLRVVSAGATPPYEINAGFYTGDELQTAINQWLAQARADGDLLFNQTFAYQATDDNDEIRSRLQYTDPAAIAAVRIARLRCSRPVVRRFLGWADDGIGGQSASDEGRFYSASQPRRWVADILGRLTLEAVTGSFVDQSAFIRPRWANLFPGVDPVTYGFVQVGEAVLPCQAPTGTADSTTLEVTTSINLILGAGDSDWPEVGADMDGSVEVRQVLILDGTFKAVVLSLLASTGSATNLNWPSFDVLPAHCSAAVPYDLLGNSAGTLEAQFDGAPATGEPITVIVHKPTRLPDLFNVSFIMRGGLQLVWRQAGLALKAFATPSTAATLTVAADDRQTPIDHVDDMRAVTEESDATLRNIIRIEHNGNPLSGDYKDSITLVDPGACGNYGARILKLTARNGSSGTEQVGEDVIELLPNLAAILTFLGRPQNLIKVPVGFNLFETCTPGEVCLFSDSFARDPSTGARGMTGRPALVVQSSYHGWGGTSQAAGEVTLMLFPRLSLAPYCPAAMVDETAGGGGYNAGTKTLTLKANGLSDAATGDATDASRLDPGSNPGSVTVRVIQRDPADPAAPLSWDDTVASRSGNDLVLTTGLPGWDSSKLYYVYSDDYGDATTAQRSNAYQADDADGLVANLRAAYSLGHFGVGQVGSGYTASVATDLPDRPANAAFGDGRALDTAHARAVAVGLNNGISYKWAAQQPEITEEMTYSGSATWQLVWCHPVFVGAGRTTPRVTRRLYIGPHIAAAAGTVSVRVTVARGMPVSADPDSISRDDIVRNAPYTEHTFTTASATYATSTPHAFAIDHLALGDGPLAGWAWCLVELGSNAKFRGFGSQYVGPLVAP